MKGGQEHRREDNRKERITGGRGHRQQTTRPQDREKVELLEGVRDVGDYPGSRKDGNQEGRGCPLTIAL